MTEPETYDQVKFLCKQTECWNDETVREKLFEEFAQKHYPELIKFKPFYMSWQKFVKGIDRLFQTFPLQATHLEKQMFIEDLIDRAHFMEVDILTSGEDPLVEGIEDPVYRELYEFQKAEPTSLVEFAKKYNQLFPGKDMKEDWKAIFHRIYRLLKAKEYYEMSGLTPVEFANLLAKDGHIVELDLLSITPARIMPTVMPTKITLEEPVY